GPSTSPVPWTPHAVGVVDKGWSGWGFSWGLGVEGRSFRWPGSVRKFCPQAVDGGVVDRGVCDLGIWLGTGVGLTGFGAGQGLWGRVIHRGESSAAGRVRGD